MAFTVLNTIALDRFVRKHRDARRAMEDWLSIVVRAAWQNLDDVRKVYRSADGVPVKVRGGAIVIVTVFNIKGNEYRLLTVINYASAVCRVIEVLTHAEYSTNRWKDRI
jgi:mRNA interferase HigB